MAANANPLVPPMDPRQMAAQGMPNPFMPPPPTASPSLGFQAWASDAQNAHKVVPAMTAPDAPLQPNAGQMASAKPPQQPPMASSAPPSQLGNDQAELQRLQKNGAGVNQIHNGFLRGLAKVGDIAGTVLAPGVMAEVPGTTVHNWQLQNQQQGRVAQDQAALQASAQLADTESQTAQRGAMGAKAQAQADAVPDQTQAKQDAVDASLAGHGLKRVTGPDGRVSIVPDEESPAYQKQQSANQLAAATIELKKAQIAVQQMKGDPNSPVNQQTAQRLKIAQQAQDRLTGMMGAMQERADATMMTAKARTVGTDMAGNPLPGSMLTEDGEVVGGQNAANVRPTGTQRTKGNMAESADQQINDMKSIVAKRADIFGPAAGRKTDFNVWLGSQDPDAQRFRAARTIAGDHLAGTFGGRSEAALSALDSAIGHFKDNPAAVTAGLNQLQEANRLFMKAGKVNTVHGKSNAMKPPTQSAQSGPKAGDVDGGYRFKGGDPANQSNWEKVK